MHPDHWRLFRRIQILDLIPVRLVPDGHRQPFVYKGAATRFSINPSPTPYSALNTVLVYFVERVRDLTADNFVGAYLQGSFALGDFDENSDADFLIVVKYNIPNSDVPALILPGSLYARATRPARFETLSTTGTDSVVSVSDSFTTGISA